MRFIFLLLPIFLLQQCFNGNNGDSINENNNGIIINDSINNGIINNDTINNVTEKDTIPKHIVIARKNIGIPSKDSIDHWLSFVGLPPNNPWCAAVQSIWLYQAGVKEPLLRTGLARNYVYQTPTRLHISAGRVLIGSVTVPIGSLAVYQRGDTRFGHIGTITEDWSGVSGVYISGNTSPPGGTGSEFSGGGVWEKPARIVPSSAFKITEFVLVQY